MALFKKSADYTAKPEVPAVEPVAATPEVPTEPGQSVHQRVLAAELVVKQIKERIEAGKARATTLEAERDSLALEAVAGEPGAVERYQAAVSEIEASGRAETMLAGALKAAEAKLAEAETARRVHENQALIRRLEKLMEKSRAKLLACTPHIEALVKSYREAMEYADRVRIAWPAGKVPMGAGLYPKEIMAFLQQELYRIGNEGAVFIGGGTQPRYAPFPAASLDHRIDKHKFTGNPTGLPTLEAEIGHAHRFLSAVLNGKPFDEPLPGTVVPKVPVEPVTLVSSPLALPQSETGEIGTGPTTAELDAETLKGPKVDMRGWPIPKRRDTSLLDPKYR